MAPKSSYGHEVSRMQLIKIKGCNSHESDLATSYLIFTNCIAVVMTNVRTGTIQKLYEYSHLPHAISLLMITLVLRLATACGLGWVSTKALSNNQIFKYLVKP